jgi:hypothetical protein
MKKTLFLLTSLVLLMLLVGCGKFEIEGEVVTESTPTAAGGEGVTDEVSPAEGPISPSNGTSFSGVRLGLIEIMLILGVLVLASLAIGAFFIIRDRTPSSGYPPSTDAADKKKGIGQLLRFKPTIGSLILALIGWAGIFGFGAILLTIGLILPVGAFTETWTPTLTMPSSILIGANLNERQIRIIPEEEACMLRLVSDQHEQLLCEVAFEGAVLAVDVELQDGMFWSCRAEFNGGSIPCIASFDNNDFQTYILVQSNLGLSQERYQRLADETFNAGWGENDWKWLARGLVGMVSLIVLVLLWRYTGSQIENPSGLVFFLRLAYSGGIGLMIFAIGSFVSFIFLLAFNLID